MCYPPPEVLRGRLIEGMGVFEEYWRCVKGQEPGCGCDTNLGKWTRCSKCHKSAPQITRRMFSVRTSEPKAKAKAWGTTRPNGGAAAAAGAADKPQEELGKGPTGSPASVAAGAKDTEMAAIDKRIDELKEDIKQVDAMGERVRADTNISDRKKAWEVELEALFRQKAQGKPVHVQVKGLESRITKLKASAVAKRAEGDKLAEEVAQLQAKQKELEAEAQKLEADVVSLQTQRDQLVVAMPTASAPEQAIATAKQLFAPIFGSLPGWQEFLDGAMAKLIVQAAEQEKQRVAKDAEVRRQEQAMRVDSSGQDGKEAGGSKRPANEVEAGDLRAAMEQVVPDLAAKLDDPAQLEALSEAVKRIKKARTESAASGGPSS